MVYHKDQLGNTRMVLTEEYQKEIYGATMETSDPNDPEIKTGPQSGRVIHPPKLLS